MKNSRYYPFFIFFLSFSAIHCSDIREGDNAGVDSPRRPQRYWSSLDAIRKEELNPGRRSEQISYVDNRGETQSESSDHRGCIPNARQIGRFNSGSEAYSGSSSDLDIDDSRRITDYLSDEDYIVDKSQVQKPGSFVEMIKTRVNGRSRANPNKARGYVASTDSPSYRRSKSNLRKSLPSPSPVSSKVITENNRKSQTPSMNASLIFRDSSGSSSNDFGGFHDSHDECEKCDVENKSSQLHTFLSENEKSRENVN